MEPAAEEEVSRRPSRLSDLVAVCAASQFDVLTALQPFQERTFLVSSSEADPIVDIAHESLIRLWGRLKDWVRAESDSAATYGRLADWVKEGFGLYTGLVLDQALLWKETKSLMGLGPNVTVLVKIHSREPSNFSIGAGKRARMPSSRRRRNGGGSSSCAERAWWRLSLGRLSC